jgi:hypothetical protein
MDDAGLPKHPSESLAAAERHGGLRLPGWAQQVLMTLLFLALALMMALVGLQLLKRWPIWPGTKTPQVLAVVDVDAALDPYKREFVLTMSQTNVSETARELANQRVALASQTVGAVLRDITQACTCVLLVRSAVFNPETLDDYTASLSEQLGQRITKAMPTPANPSRPEAKP